LVLAFGQVKSNKLLRDILQLIGKMITGTLDEAKKLQYVGLVKGVIKSL
jgi:predicted secreted protein